MGSRAASAAFFMDRRGLASGSSSPVHLSCRFFRTKSNDLAVDNGDMKRLITALLLASSLCTLGVRAEEPDSNYTFATKEEALQRAKEMGLT